VLAIGAAVLLSLVVAQDKMQPIEPSTGFPGGIQIGIKPVFEGRLSSADGRIELPYGNLNTAFVEVTTVLLDDADCAYRPGLDPCLSAQDARVDFSLSAMLDFREVLSVNGAGTVSFRIQGNEPIVQQLPLEIPTLSPGRHCVVIAIAEDAATVVATGSPDHTTVVGLQVEVPGGTDNHCVHPPTINDQVASPSRNIPGSSCAFPVLGPDRDGLTIQRELEEDQFMYAALPLCSERTTGFFIHNELLVTEGRYSPVALTAQRRELGQQRIRQIGVLPSGSWRLGVFADQSGGQDTSAYVSMPVVAP
jgi:hypothetical protein